MYDEIEKDILNWLIEFIEPTHVFYNHKFSICPYAKSARLNGLVNINVYKDGGIKKFLLKNFESESKKIEILVFPPQLWYFGIIRFIKKSNKFLILKDRYAQYGEAITTKSKYTGLLKNSPYFIVIINNLSDVLEGQILLSKTDYYKDWSKEHYYNVVIQRYNQVKNIIR
jgi:hypothetical protein